MKKLLEILDEDIVLDDEKKQLQQTLREKYADQLNRNMDLDINYAEGWNNLVTVGHSNDLIDHCIEPTKENLNQLQEELEATIAEIEEQKKKYPPEPVSIETPAQIRGPKEHMDVTGKEIIDIWFPEGLPTADDKVLAAWAGISLKIALIPMELAKMKKEITPVGIERIQATMKFLGIGWNELFEGACCAVGEGVSCLKELIPDVPDETLSSGDEAAPGGQV
ncbi:MAG: hypothetical protein WC364_13460 [Eubacteriales bacterium]|jgi:hypothetical protein